MNKAERAHKALIECADALDDLPLGIRRISFLGTYFVEPDTLRKEAEALMTRINTAKEAMEESGPKEDLT